MGYKNINTSLDVEHYYQDNNDWKNLVLKTGNQKSTIGKVGCALTCGAMLEKKTPKELYEDFNMTDLSCDWSKLPTYSISHKNVKNATDAADKLFAYIVIEETPIILFGDDGKGGVYSTHFVIVRGFQGKVAVDPDGNYSPTSSDLAQYKVYDPSSKYDAANAKEFNDDFPIKSFRVPTEK